MKVKVGDKVYDGNDVPVMVILRKEDKENIKNMQPDSTKYCAFPESMSLTEAKKWMKTK